MVILNQFLLRLAFGLAVGMAVTSPRQVSSGYFRNHLYVTLGLSTLAALVSLSAGFTWWPAAAAAVLSYAGSVCWLYEWSRGGKTVLWLVAGLALCGAWLGLQAGTAMPTPLETATLVTSGLTLGVTTAAMLLGHWYLNSPGMRMEPLFRLLLISAAAIVAHIVLSGIGLVADLSTGSGLSSVEGWLMVLRWVFGFAGPLLLIAMAWQTLRIPNTQSATGILYVAVIAVFAGELAALLLSAPAVFSV